VSIYQLKPLSKAAVPAALEKAERYRLLNEPGEAVSICEDVLAIEPGHQDALVILLLALTDQLLEAPAVASKAQQVARSLSDEYDRLYYEGIIAERTAKAHLRRGGMSPEGVYEWLADAMECYERAESLRPAGNDDAILRWNACARVLKENPNLRPAVDDRREPQFLE
jgi:hypothetical protein